MFYIHRFQIFKTIKMSEPVKDTEEETQHADDNSQGKRNAKG